MRRTLSAGGGAVSLLALVMVLGAAALPARSEQPNPAEAARIVLDAGRRALNEGQYAVAADRFREYLKTQGEGKDAPAARYGLAVALLDGPDKNFREAVDVLQPVADREGFADRPFALYYLGAAYRGLGNQALADAAAKPNEAAALRASATPRFEEAAKRFAHASAAFLARSKAAKAPDAAAADFEWAARARSDQDEMLIGVGKFKDAADAAAALLADPAMKDSKYRPLTLYHLGYAKFALRDYLGAGRALSDLAPFQQEFGAHARYLLARTHHLAGERPEAAAQYNAIVAAYDAQRKKARDALANPAALKPEQKAALEAVVNAPPDYVARARFYAALLMAEDGRYADALERFMAVQRQGAGSPLALESQLRIGFCQLQLKNFKGAMDTLQPLRDHPQLGDQASWWWARAQVSAADPNNAPALAQALAAAADALRRGADRAAELAKTDPAAKVRRGDILLELADTQQLARQYNEAVATYHQVLSENANPDRSEEAMQRQVAALHLGGRYQDSDELARRFEKTYPKSTLLGSVLFREAENAYLAATAAAADAKRAPEAPRLFTESVTRYERLLKQYPEFPHVHLARQGLAAAHYRLGRFAEAAAALAAIPEAARTGDLATVPYLLADCHIRMLPGEAEDAVRAARLVEQAEQAAKLLEAFLAARGDGPQAPDALLKLGHAYQRMGSVLADATERQKTLLQAREAYERVIQKFPKDAAVPTAVFERAKVLALLGDPAAAANELRKFQADPLASAPIAPMALLRLMTLLRLQGKPADGATLLAECRSRHEAALLKDPARSDWVPMLQYEHALAVKESGKPAEARKMFEAVAKQFAGRPEAVNSVWRAVQCRREEVMAQVAAARQVFANPAAKPEEIEPARAAIEEGLKALRQAAATLQPQADELGKKMAGSEAHLRTLYEVAWCHRVLADAEIAAARQKLERTALEKARGKLAQNLPQGQTLAALRAPEIPVSVIPVQPSENLANDAYKRLISSSPDATLAAQARFELAEMHALRASPVTALDLLAKALESNPPPEMAERLRLRLAATLLAMGDPKAALAHARAVGKNAAGPFAGEARYLAAEAFLQQKDWAKAIEQLIPFRDQEPMRRIRDVSERAMLRLGQACTQAGQWDAARQAFNALAERFPQSPWIDEARFGIGQTYQGQKQYDNAVNTYNDVIRRTAAEVAARAQFQIGLCLMEQGRFPDAAKALLVVPVTYDYPETSAAALTEAARAYTEMKQPAEAVKLWRRIVQDHPASRWADAARKRLAEMKS